MVVVEKRISWHEAGVASAASSELLASTRTPVSSEAIPVSQQSGRLVYQAARFCSIKTVCDLEAELELGDVLREQNPVETVAAIQTPVVAVDSLHFDPALSPKPRVSLVAKRCAGAGSSSSGSQHCCLFWSGQESKKRLLWTTAVVRPDLSRLPNPRIHFWKY